MDLRLIVVTDRTLAAPRDLHIVVRACLEAGAPAVQLRDKRATARRLYEQALELRRLTREFGALLFVNDRLDVGRAAGADGVHLGPDDLPIRAARRAAPPTFLIGFSTDDPVEAARAESDGADYIGCGAVFGTATKAEATGERIGTERLAQVVRAVGVPVVGIGGIGPENVAEVARAGAAGAAAVRSLMTAPAPAEAATAMLRAFASSAP